MQFELFVLDSFISVEFVLFVLTSPFFSLSRQKKTSSLIGRQHNKQRARWKKNIHQIIIITTNQLHAIEILMLFISFVWEQAIWVDWIQTVHFLCAASELLFFNIQITNPDWNGEWEFVFLRDDFVEIVSWFYELCVCTHTTTTTTIRKKRLAKMEPFCDQRINY